jgi:hypothetical protein
VSQETLFPAERGATANLAERITRGLGMLALGIFGLVVGTVIGVLAAFWTGLIVLQC